MFSILGIVIGCMLLLPHELLHGICFPKGSRVELYQMMKPAKMFVTSDKSMSRGRFIFMSLFPSLVLGLLPLLIWLYISPYTYLAKTLFSIGFIGMITAGKDFMNEDIGKCSSLLQSTDVRSESVLHSAFPTGR